MRTLTIDNGVIDNGALNNGAIDKAFHLLSKRSRVERLELSLEVADERRVASGLSENPLDAWDAVWDEWE